MKKITYLIIGIIVIIAIILAVTYSKKTPAPLETIDVSNNIPMATQQETVPSAPTTNGKKMSFGEFTKQGGSYQCTVDEYLDPSYTTTTKGTIYLSNGLVRGDFSFEIQGESMKTSFIKRDGLVYTWIPGRSPGYKTPALEHAPSSGQSGWTPDMVGDYTCKPWTADVTLFTVPNIQFETLK